MNNVRKQEIIYSMDQLEPSSLWKFTPLS